MDTYRPLSAYEYTLVRRLLEANTTPIVSIVDLRKAEVKEIDEYGSLKFRTRTRSALDVRLQKTPFEGVALDSDGVEIYALLFTYNGNLGELQLYKADGTPIRKFPIVENWSVVNRSY